MLRSVEGIYRNGKVELFEAPEGIPETPVIVTLLSSKRLIDLRERGIDETEAAQLRGQFATFAEDWERPEMDDYDAL